MKRLINRKEVLEYCTAYALYSTLQYSIHLGGRERGREKSEFFIIAGIIIIIISGIARKSPPTKYHFRFKEKI